MKKPKKGDIVKHVDENGVTTFGVVLKVSVVYLVQWKNGAGIKLTDYAPRLKIIRKRK